MPTFHESGLAFTFPDDWAVLPFDQHPYYHVLSGHGVSGVDFMALLSDGTLLLLEVKNYTDPYPDRDLAQLPGFVHNFEGYSQRMARKLTDSLRAVRIVDRMLRRKRWYRFLIRYPNWLKRLAPRWWWWHQAAVAGASTDKIWFVLWAENLEPIGGYAVTEFAHLKRKLEQRVRDLLVETTERVEIRWIGSESETIFQVTVLQIGLI